MLVPHCTLGLFLEAIKRVEYFILRSINTCISSCKSSTYLMLKKSFVHSIMNYKKADREVTD